MCLLLLLLKLRFRLTYTSEALEQQSSSAIEQQSIRAAEQQSSRAAARTSAVNRLERALSSRSIRSSTAVMLRALLSHSLALSAALPASLFTKLTRSRAHSGDELRGQQHVCSDLRDALSN